MEFNFFWEKINGPGKYHPDSKLGPSNKIRPEMVDPLHKISRYPVTENSKTLLPVFSELVMYK
jgi:hypothetical protein